LTNNYAKANIHPINTRQRETNRVRGRQVRPRGYWARGLKSGGAGSFGRLQGHHGGEKRNLRILMGMEMKTLMFALAGEIVSTSAVAKKIWLGSIGTNRQYLEQQALSVFRKLRAAGQ